MFLKYKLYNIHLFLSQGICLSNAVSLTFNIVFTWATQDVPDEVIVVSYFVPGPDTPGERVSGWC